MSTFDQQSEANDYSGASGHTVGAAYSRNIDWSERVDCAVCSVSPFELSLPVVTTEFKLNNERVSTMSNELSTVVENDEVSGQNEGNEVATPVEFSDKSAVAKCTKYVDFDDLYRADNVRGQRDVQLPSIVASLRKNGFKPNHPLVVSKKADGRYLVLCGNRRVMGIEFIRDNHAEEFGRLVNKGKIPCIVHEGLTAEEEIIIRNDHSGDEDRVGLSDWGQFLAVKQLLRVFPGESETKIAEKMGLFHVKGKSAGKPNRSIIQPRVNLARLPNFIQEEYRKLWDDVDGKAKTRVRVDNIKTLYQAYRDEYAAFPDGNGPKLSAAWDSIINPVGVDDDSDSNDSNGAVAPKALSVESANTKGMGCTSGLVKRILLAVTNQGGVLSELDAQAVTLETDSQILSDIRNLLGQEDFDDLAIRAREYRQSEEIAKA